VEAQNTMEVSWRRKLKGFKEFFSMSKRHEDELEIRLLRQLDGRIESMQHALIKILLLLKDLNNPSQEATSFQINQTGVSNDMANSITGIVIGGKASFAALAVPAGSVIVGGAIPSWTSTDPLAVLVASTDGMSATVTLDPSALVGGNTSLTVTATNTDGSIVTGTAVVPYLPAPPPPPVQALSFDINQTA
jgi:hypothetical protein